MDWKHQRARNRMAYARERGEDLAAARAELRQQFRETEEKPEHWRLPASSLTPAQLSVAIKEGDISVAKR